MTVTLPCKLGETMDDLFTIFIILAFIISFLNKIFGKKTKPQTTQRQPTPRQKQPDWLPPWLQLDETEAQLPSERGEDLDIIEQVEYNTGSMDILEQPKKAPVQQTISEKKFFLEKRESTELAEAIPLKALGIELSSRDDLRRGIVLAEILGPCRARRKLRKM